MLPGFLTRAVELLLGREGSHSLHLRAAGGATVVLVVVMLLGSWAVTAAEHGAPRANLTSYPKALWWSVETATTVGYGDFYHVTFWGRVVGAAVMGVGITTYGMVTAAIATWFVGREQKRHQLTHRAHELCDETARALHERFDRLERRLGVEGDRD
ncbi:potassium channel family protein [Streptomyces bottropensis]|uniref:KcsA protein n=1 Tax=Streptomyces bottropensis ATCC 25435 TaxID=1054862 RepID=M3ESU2_9ACTN|nr:potassium channel family protein [Streptomyces bottropensis]EMF52163.1 kcsA protein [Streptomyces bottropensis ATCC 25435]MZD22594.1 voltage-gated potassium channel [Streptomyces sp. SID5476]